MKRFIKSVSFVGLAVILLGAGVETVNLPSNTTTVYAKKTSKKAKWHKGTPKELRGKYKWGRNTKHPLASNFDWSQKIISSKNIDTYYKGMSGIYGYNIKYRRLASHRYELKYDVHKNGLVRGRKNQKEYIEKKGNKIFDPTAKKGRIYYHKVKHF